jgi:hypothetical protein
MNRIFVIVLILTTALMACNKTEEVCNSPIFEVKKDQTVTMSSIQIRLDSVQDSRCPDGATCIQAGQAVAKLTFIQGSEQVSKSLQVTGLVRTPKPDTVLVFDKKAILLNVFPYPSVNVPVQQKDYKVLMKLE